MVSTSLVPFPVCPIRQAFSLSRPRAARQGVDGGTDVSISGVSFYTACSDLLFFPGRQGKFQLEVLPDVGHYLHEVRRFIMVLSFTCSGSPHTFTSGQARKARHGLGRVLAQEHNYTGVASKDGQHDSCPKAQDGRRRLTTDLPDNTFCIICNTAFASRSGINDKTPIINQTPCIQPRNFPD